MFEIQRTMGDAAGASCVVILRKGGRAPPFSSRSYLHSCPVRKRKELGGYRGLPIE